MKNKILISVNYIMFAILAISLSCLDSQSDIPLYIALASGLYLVLFVIANKERYTIKD